SLPLGSSLGDITIINCYASWQAYENFAFSKQEFLNEISIVFSLFIARHCEEAYYVFFESDV
ncbi:MAG: hypothetical protein MUO60_07340, partial [Clostridiaceae bacterium]|nr:hypothetical protein [Clostridiaceae bacterium]